MGGFHRGRRGGCGRRDRGRRRRPGSERISAAIVLPSQPAGRGQQNQNQENPSPSDRSLRVLLLEKITGRTAARGIIQPQKRHSPGHRQIRFRRSARWSVRRLRSRRRGQPGRRCSRFRGSFLFRGRLKYRPADSTIMINRAVLIPALCTANHSRGFHIANNTRLRHAIKITAKGTRLAASLNVKNPLGEASLRVPPGVSTLPSSSVSTATGTFR